ncbi:PAS domain S-box-containing protein [Flavobacterium gillisiae]|uniref:histidine kinase n=1 Tax=Flavobacterium gillisiae TaxID=150146 RepID=A0A1H3X4C9_9FLAO|nr:PAS domain S-box protein [Flavobacterium gillisiae]SDZ93378.1 PAS domain S-box-containing protein [Flavobacterium gillisiae]
MHTSKAIPSSNLLELNITDHVLKKEFDTILDFVTDICKISDAFISIKVEQKDIIVSKKGLENFSTPNEIAHFTELTTSHNNIVILPGTNQNDNNQLNGNKETFAFFAGFPINTSNNSISASLCIINKKTNRISTNELKILKQCVSQIESILNLSLKNYDLKTQLSETKMKFQSFIENSNEIIYELTLEGTISSVSKNFALSVGYEAYEVIGKSNATLIHPQDIEKYSDFLQNIKLNENNNKELSYRVLHKSGRYIWHSSKINLIEKNNKQFYIGNCRDITEFVESQQELKLQKEFYETILDRLPTDVAVFNSNYKYIYVNPIAIKNKELREYIIGKDDFEYTKHTNRADTFAIERRAKFNIAVQTKETLSWEEELYNAVGEQSFHNRKFTPVFNKNGTLEIMIGFSVDITETKKRQNEILNSRQLVTSVIENVAVGILVQDPQSEIIENNKAACEMLGLTQDQLLGKTSFDEHWEVIHEDGSTFTAEEHPVPQAIKKLKSINNIVMGVRRPTKNDLVWLLVDAIPVFGDANQFLYVICSFNDITAQKKTEKELKISNERFTYVNMATSDVIWDWEIGSENFIMSENYTKLFGYKLKNKNNFLKVKRFDNLIHPDDIERVHENLKTTLESKSTTLYDEFRYLKSDGTYVYLKDKAYIIRDESGKAIRMIGAQTDVTEIKKFEEQNKLLLEENNKNKSNLLNKAESLYRLLADNTMHLVCLHDLNMTFQYVSPSIKALAGYTPENLIGKTPMDFTHPEDLLGMKTDIYNLTSNHAATRFEYRYITSTGVYIWLETYAKVVFENAIPIRIQTSTRDISERKEAEFIIDKALKQERELNELRNNLVSTISHEFRTPMTTIRTSAELIEMYLEGQNFDNEHNLRKQTNRITGEIDRIIELMNAVLTISKDDSGKTKFHPIKFDLKELCCNVIDTSFSNNKGGQKVDLYFEGDQFLIYADKNLIEYAIFNLIHNAFKYSENCESVQLRLISNKSEIQLEIIDFGIGIPENDQPKLFNTFYRASNTDGIEGTGLGLYIVKTFLEKNSGKIKLESQLRKGTKVTIQLPKA